MQELQENSYMQYFVGLHEFHAEPLFEPCMMVHFRKRFLVEEVAKINDYVYTGKWPEEQRNVDRNDDEDDEDKPAALPSSEREKRTRTRLTRKGDAGKRIGGNCSWTPRWLPPTSSTQQTSI